MVVRPVHALEFSGICVRAAGGQLLALSSGHHRRQREEATTLIMATKRDPIGSRKLVAAGAEPREQLGDMAVTKREATPRKQHDETSTCSLDRARHRGASLRANANSTPDANDRPGRNNNRIPKGGPCSERVNAERWWSAKRGKAVHTKRRISAHAFNAPLKLRLAFPYRRQRPRPNKNSEGLGRRRL